MRLVCSIHNVERCFSAGDVGQVCSISILWTTWASWGFHSSKLRIWLLFHRQNIIKLDMQFTSAIFAVLFFQILWLNSLIRFTLLVISNALNDSTQAAITLSEGFDDCISKLILHLLLNLL